MHTLGRMHLLHTVNSGLVMRSESRCYALPISLSSASR